jgi:hypothetical protein
VRIQSRADGRLEIVCRCGVGHPSKLLMEAAGRTWREVDGVHGCCGNGCCQKPAFKKRERQMTGAAQDLGRSE